MRNDDGRSFSQKVAEQGTTEPNSDITSSPFFKRLDDRFTEVKENVPGYDNKTYSVGGNEYIVTKKNDGKVSVTDKNNTEDTQNFNTEDEAFNFLVNKEGNSVGGRNMAQNQLPQEDGVVAEKDDPAKSGKTEDMPRYTLVYGKNSIPMFWDWYNSKIRGTEWENGFNLDKAFETAMMLSSRGWSESGNVLALDLQHEGVDKQTGERFVGAARFLDKNGNVIDINSAEGLRQLKENGVQNAIIQLNRGADVVTAMHEITHIGWWNQTQQDRNYFCAWALKTENEFVRRVLQWKINKEANNRKVRKMLAETDEEKQRITEVPQQIIDGLNNEKFDASTFINEIKAQDAELYDSIMGNEAKGISGEASIIQTLAILKPEYQGKNIMKLMDKNGILPMDLQVAMEERFAWEGSLWYAEGFTRGQQPRNIIERILDRVCRSLGDALGLVWDYSERMEKSQELVLNGKKINYNPISSFANLSLKNNRGQQEQQ